MRKDAYQVSAAKVKDLILALPKEHLHRQLTRKRVHSEISLQAHKQAHTSLSRSCLNDKSKSQPRWSSIVRPLAQTAIARPNGH